MQTDAAVLRAAGPVVRARVDIGADGTPVVVVGDRVIPWDAVGEAVAGGEIIFVLPPEEEAEDDLAVLSDHVLPPIRPALDDVEAEVWEEAVALLTDCIPPAIRQPCPIGDLAAACRRVRADLAAGSQMWAHLATALGWGPEGPVDDRDLWTACAAAAAVVPIAGIDPAGTQGLEAMDIDDWLAAVIELVRSGSGTPASPGELLALSARCLHVDSGAVDPVAAPLLGQALTAIVPMWRRLGAIGDDGTLTPLGAWGLPHAFARAWGGALEEYIR